MIKKMRTKTAVTVCALMLAACGHNSSPAGSQGLRAGCRVANAEKKNAENVMAGLKNHGSSRSPSPRRAC
jgi:ABC-type glycerol-3-phosphate transport system substrate-binding protein